MRLTIFLVVLALMPHVSNARPPDPVLKQMEVMARINAAIGICIDSSEFKRFDSNKALKFFDISIKIDYIIEEIAERYNDKGAHLVYTLASQDLRQSAEFRRGFFRSYSRPCAEQLLVDAEKEISDTRSRVRALIRR